MKRIIQKLINKQTKGSSENMWTYVSRKNYAGYEKILQNNEINIFGYSYINQSVHLYYLTLYQFLLSRDSVRSGTLDRMKKQTHLALGKNSQSKFLGAFRKRLPSCELAKYC